MNHTTARRTLPGSQMTWPSQVCLLKGRHETAGLDLLCELASGLDARKRRADVSGRHPRPGKRSRGRDPWRRGHAHQRSDEHRPHHRDQRSRRVRLRQRAARQLLNQGDAVGLQDRRAQGRHGRARNSSWSWTSRCRSASSPSRSRSSATRPSSNASRPRWRRRSARSSWKRCRSSGATPSTRRLPRRT